MTQKKKEEKIEKYDARQICVIKGISGVNSKVLTDLFQNKEMTENEWEKIIVQYGL